LKSNSGLRQRNAVESDEGLPASGATDKTGFEVIGLIEELSCAVISVPVHPVIITIRKA
jgi:hypothetical protein